MTQQSIPAAEAKIDYWNLYACEVLGMPEGWRWCEVKAVGDDRDTGACVMRGAVPIGAISRGPSKGWPKWPKKLNELVVTFKDYDAFVAQKKNGVPK